MQHGTMTVVLSTINFCLDKFTVSGLNTLDGFFLLVTSCNNVLDQRTDLPMEQTEPDLTM